MRVARRCRRLGVTEQLADDDKALPTRSRASLKDRKSGISALGVSVRGWTRSVVGHKFRSNETVWSHAVAHEHGLACPQLNEAAAP